jgi:nucleoside-diphosphate-sugar epimerase
MKRILITGAFGFVGSNLSRYLASDQSMELIGLDLIGRKDSHYSRVFTWKDLESIDFDSIDTIIHLAGKAHDTNDTASENEYFDVNVGLTKQIYPAFLRSKACKFIFFSSVKAVADTVAGTVLTEDVVPHPMTPYGKSKLAAENYLSSMNPHEGRSVYVLRPCMIHGPGNKGNLNLLYGFVKQGMPYPLGKFNNLRSFASIENVTYVVRELIDKTIQPGMYLVGDDEPVSTRELIELMARSLDRNPRIWNLPEGLVRMFAYAGDLFHLPLNSERLKKMTEAYVVSNGKLKSALGISELPVTAKDGLLRTFSSFLNQSRNS